MTRIESGADARSGLTTGEELAEASEKALDDLYGHLDAYGAGKRTAYVIERLIEAKIAEALHMYGNRSGDFPTDEEFGDADLMGDEDTYREEGDR
jgi:hypothetical protein